jgi:hypothetical protein
MRDLNFFKTFFVFPLFIYGELSKFWRMDDFLDLFVENWLDLEVKFCSGMFESESIPEIRTTELVLTDCASLDEKGIFF